MGQVFDYFAFLKTNRDVNDKSQRKHIHAIEASYLTATSYMDKMGVLRTKCTVTEPKLETSFSKL